MNLEELLRKIVEDPWDDSWISERAVLELLGAVEAKLDNTPQLIELHGSVLVVGDTHGDLQSSLNAFKIKADEYLFLGDYVDRGPQQLQNICYLFARLLRDEVVLLRGNHESPLMNRYYGFYDVVRSRLPRGVYAGFSRAFSLMPYSALINSRVWAVHGGLAVGLQSLREVSKLPKLDQVPSNEISFQLLWNDPDESVEYFSPSPRGEGIYLYGKLAVDEFLRNNGLSYIIRAHEYYPFGVQTHFEGKVITVFSCRFYPIEGPKAILVEESGCWSTVDLA